jgi:hypothetical protein
VTISTHSALIAIVDDPAPGTVSDFLDKSRCAELHTAADGASSFAATTGSTSCDAEM